VAKKIEAELQGIKPREIKPLYSSENATEIPFFIVFSLRQKILNQNSLKYSGWKTKQRLIKTNLI
jgi:hypothetical protein